MRTLGFWQSLLRRSLAPYLLAFLILTVIGIWSARTGLIPGIQSGDDKDQYMPGRAFSAEVLRSGSLPEWNPFIYTGYPHIADVQNGFFYPPNLILYQLFSPSTAHNLSIAFNVFLIVILYQPFLAPVCKIGRGRMDRFGHLRSSRLLVLQRGHRYHSGFGSLDPCGLLVCRKMDPHRPLAILRLGEAFAW
jgi:hypothetical protein